MILDESSPIVRAVGRCDQLLEDSKLPPDGSIRSRILRVGIGSRRAIFVLLALAVSFCFLLHAVPEMMRTAGMYPVDGFIDWGGAKEMLAGRNPYSLASLRIIGLSQKEGLGHPPTTLIWFYPLAHLGVVWTPDLLDAGPRIDPSRPAPDAQVETRTVAT